MGVQLKRFLNDRSGATAIEYGLIGALVAMCIFAAIVLLGNGLSDLFTGVSNTAGNTLDDAQGLL